MRGPFRRRRTWIVAAAAALVVVALGRALEQPTVWVRWDSGVAAECAWAAENVTVTQIPGGAMTLRARGDIRVEGIPRFPAVTSGFWFSPTSPSGARAVFSPGDSAVCWDAPGGPRVAAESIAGIGVDSRELFLRHDPWWRRTVRRFAPSMALGPRVVRLVASEERILDGVAWRRFVWAPVASPTAPAPAFVHVSRPR